MPLFAQSFSQVLLDDTQQRLLWKIASALFIPGSDPRFSPRLEDTRQRLTWKIVSLIFPVGGDLIFAPRLDDTWQRLLWKWASLLFSPGDPARLQPRMDDLEQRLLWKIADLLSAGKSESFECCEPREIQRLLYEIAVMVQSGSPTPPTPPALPGKPITPGPTSGAVDVPIAGVVLSWVDGGGATGYDVWFNGAQVASNFPGTSMAVPGLANSTVYVWRVNAVNSAGTTTGDYWSFSTIVAPPSKPTTPTPANGAVNQPITGVWLSWVNGGGATGYDVWFNGVQVAFNQPGTTYALGLLLNNHGYTWRVDAVGPGGTTTGDSWNFGTIVSAPSKAITPSPANGATGVLPYAPVLSWVDGGGATSYNVYFNGSLIGNQIGTTYAPTPPLAFNTAFTWRIDSVNIGGVTTGDTWGFTTAAAFAWAPAATSLASWHDLAGSHNGNLATFNATADFATVDSLAVSSLTSISNISSLPSLAMLNVLGGSLTALDLTGCSALTNLNCGANHLTSLTLTGCTALDTLVCYQNSLATLALTGLTALTYLNCVNNSLTALSLAPVTALTYLNCSGNALVTLNVSSNTNLATLKCGTCSLTALNVGSNPALTDLECGDNAITTLNLSANTALTMLDIGSTSIVAVDLSANTLLQNLSSGGNAITTFSLAGLVNLTGVDFNTCYLTTLDISTNTALVGLDVSANNLTVLAVNTILVNLDNAGLPNGSVDVSGQTPSAPPDSGPPDGATAASDLNGNGWSVSTD